MGGFLEDELKAVEKAFPKPELETNFASLIQVTILKNRYKKVTVRLQPDESYPNSPVMVELKSPSIDASLLDKMAKAAEKEGKDKVGGPQCVAALTVVKNFVDHNALLMAYSELSSIKSLLSENDSLKLNERKGTIQVKLVKDQYYLKISLTIGDLYPEDPVEIELVDSNFNESFSRIFLTQARDVVRKLVAGMSAKVAFDEANPEKPKNWAPSSATLQNIKHDVAFLKKASDLSALSNDKAMRRQKTRLVKAETERERELAKKSESSLEKKDYANPALFHVVQFIVQEYVHRLPGETCQVCQNPIMPRDPAKQTLIPKDLRAERVYCGHWYHFKCLNKYITEPPFGKECPTCKLRVYHHKWTSDLKALEKRWANQEAKKREVNEVAEFLGVEDAKRSSRDCGYDDLL